MGNLNLADFMDRLNDLIELQKSETYQELCPPEIKQAKNEPIKVKVTEEPGYYFFSGPAHIDSGCVSSQIIICYKVRYYYLIVFCGGEFGLG